MTLAISLLLAAAAAQSPSADAVLARGMEQFHHGEYAAALRTLEEASRLSPGEPRAATFLALTRAATGDCAHAQDELLRQFAHVTDRDLRRLAGIGAAQCLLGGNRFSELFPVLFALHQAYPDDANVLYESAKAYNKAWNETVHEMFRKTPASYRVNQLSAEVFEIQGRYPEAVAEYRKAIEKNPRAINLHFRLGRAILMQSHDPAALIEARKEFEAELALNPSDSVAEYQIGQIAVAEQKPAEAAPRFQRAIDLRPDFPEALVALARIHVSEKRYGDAIPLLERAIRVQPRMEAAHYSLMLAYRDAGRMEDAQREKAELDKLQRPPEGEFTDFLKRLGEKAPQP